MKQKFYLIVNSEYLFRFANSARRCEMMRFGVLGPDASARSMRRTLARSGRAKVAYVADAMPEAATALADAVGAKVGRRSTR